MDQVYINIRKRRNELGLSQRDLAKACGYSDNTTIAKMEKGKVDISIGRLQQIAEILRIDPAALMGWREWPDE